jgi:hypothetical protein
MSIMDVGFHNHIAMIVEVQDAAQMKTARSEKDSRIRRTVI